MRAAGETQVEMEGRLEGRLAEEGWNWQQKRHVMDSGRGREPYVGADEWCGM